MKYQCTEELFLRDVAEHEMTVIRDEGVHRHIRFRKPGTICMGFDLITWPGCLCYCGDMGTFVFQRLQDMFEFFRMDRRDFNYRKDRSIQINPQYWAEKLEATNNSGGHTEFSEELFKQAVMGDLLSWLRNHRDETTKEERRELWEAVCDQVLGADGDSGGYRMQAAAHDFTHFVSKEAGEFYFQDFWEHRLTDYTFHFIWCCYALAWGIQKYDESKPVAKAA